MRRISMNGMTLSQKIKVTEEPMGSIGIITAPNLCPLQCKFTRPLVKRVICLTFSLWTQSCDLFWSVTWSIALPDLASKNAGRSGRNEVCPCHANPKRPCMFLPTFVSLSAWASWGPSGTPA
jgi:hypothetical protein